MKTIPLTQGKVALVDDEDFERINKYKWYADYDGYGWRAVRHHVVEAIDWNDARRIMCERFGKKWSMQYESAEEAGVEKFNLREIK